MKHRELQFLFRQDEAKWTENLLIKKREAKEVNAKLKAKFEALINSSMSMLGEIAPPKIKFTLRKLPMWGEQVTHEKINFEWST